jgi:hypothetical protein
VTPAAEVLAELRERGISVLADGERLRLRPPHALTPELLERARVLKPELLRLLADTHDARCGTLDQDLGVREVLGFPAALLPELPLPTTLVLELPDSRRLNWAVHLGCGRADRDAEQWRTLCGSDRRRTVHEVLGELGATLRAVVIEGGSDGATD